MSFNLLKLVQGYLTDELVSQAGSFLGESNEGISKALSGIIPLVIGKFTDQASTKSGAQQLLDTAKSEEGTGILENLGSFFGDGNQDLMSKGTKVVSQLFGGNANKLIDEVASFSGIKNNSVTALLSMAAPTVLGAIGKGAKDHNIDATGLSEMIDSQSSGLLGFIPESLQGLIGTLGLGKIGSLLTNTVGSIGEGVSATAEKTGEVISDVAETVASGAGKVVDGAADLAEDAVEAGKSAVEKTGEVIGEATDAVAEGAEKVAEKTTSFIKWLLPLVLLIGIVFLLWKCFSEPAKDTINAVGEGIENVADGAVEAGKSAVEKTGEVIGETTDAVTEGAEKVIEGVAGTLDATGNFIYDLGKETEITLPEGVILKVGDNSTEAKLLVALKGDQPIDTDKTKGWITCDRLYFQHGSSDLTATSDEQLKNLVAILKAFPTTKIKIGGYTDNTGTLEANKEISQKRAETAKEKLVSLGVNASQITAEGYGQEHPVCPANDTDECKAQNRRIDLRVMAK
ncbi:MAG: DUF937 domain-containing protein [Flavobacteriales bacterium]